MELFKVQLIIILHCCIKISGQTVPTVYGSSFAVAFPPIRESSASGTDECKIIINSAFAQTTVTIQTITGGSQVELGAGETYVYEDINCASRISDEGTESKAIYVTSNRAISVLILSNDGTGNQYNNMDATLMYPVDFANFTTTEFYVYNYNKQSDDGTTNSCGVSTDTANFYIIVTSEDSTTVSISPPPYSQVSTFTLDRFETRFFRNTVAERLTDYTGTYITSNKPIALIAGTLCADATITPEDSEGVAWGAMPPVSAYTAGDYISYEIYTTDAGGTEQPDYYDIVVLASQGNTQVTIAGIQTTLARGQVRQYQVQDAALKISCSLKCMVMEFMKNYENDLTNGICMTQIQPVASYGTYSVFTNYQVGLTDQYYILILTLGDTVYDDIIISGPTQEQPWTCSTIPGDTDRVCSYLGRINDEVFGLIRTNNEEAAFTAMVYWSSTQAGGKGYCYNTGVAYV